jgi:hypothetical protein
MTNVTTESELVRLRALNRKLWTTLWILGANGTFMWIALIANAATRCQ